jgi:proteasome activator subunit 4
VLQWLWISAHGQQAALMFPYAITMLPEVLRMSELNDSSELQIYSSAVLYVISAVSCPPRYLPVILDNFVSAVKSTGVRGVICSMAIS